MRANHGYAVRAPGARVLREPSVFHASRDRPRAARVAADSERARVGMSPGTGPGRTGAHLLLQSLTPTCRGRNLRLRSGRLLRPWATVVTQACESVTIVACGSDSALRALLRSTPHHEGLSCNRSVERVPGFRIASNGVRCGLVWPALRAHAVPGRGGARSRAHGRRRASRLGRDRFSRRGDAPPGPGLQERGGDAHLCRGSRALGSLPRRLARAAARGRDVGRWQPDPRRRSGAECSYLPGQRVFGMRR